MEKEMIRKQNEMASRLKTAGITMKQIHITAGIDTAYWEKDGKEYGVAVIVLFDHHTHAVLERVYASGEVTVPYIPGLLAFRELPLIRQAFTRLKKRPDLLLFDGNGYLHPRHMGIASQASIELGIPSIGVAKTFYHYGDGQYVMPENTAGAWTDIIVNGQVDGRALRTQKDVKPVFVSIGNRIDLDMATAVVQSYSDPGSHIPLPTRYADLETKRLRRQLSA